MYQNASKVAMMTHPDNYFTCPQELLSSPLSTSFKKQLLEQWRDQLLQLERADEENMGNDSVAERLSEVSDCLLHTKA